MSYTGFVCQIKNLRDHPNADRLYLGECFGNTVCVSKTGYTDGMTGAYFPTDGQLSVEFAENNNLVRKKDENGNNVGGYMDPDKRNITAIKLRGEKSDGLFLPLSCLDYCFEDEAAAHLKLGDTISVVNGHEICCKYIPRQQHHRGGYSEGNRTRKKKVKETSFPYFNEHIDTPQLRFCSNMFKPGDIICLTEKVHGTSSRNANTLTVSYKKNIFDKIFGLKGRCVEKYEEVIGTRRTIVSQTEGGYYGSNQFRIDWGENFKNKLHPGETVFGEIAGWIDETTPVMGIADNKKTKDKDFINKYGDKTTFTYGCEPGKSRFFVYRMTLTSPDGYVVEYPWDLVKLRAEQMGLEIVPELDRFIYTTEEDFNSRIQRWMDVSSTIDATHIIEGVVVRALNAPDFRVAKEKSFLFKVIEGIVKENADTPDVEEAEELL